jgi:hypothetical protein
VRWEQKNERALAMARAEAPSWVRGDATHA